MIIAAGLTPAWQQVLVLERLHLGQVNRALSVTTCASGKVLNVGLALHALGAESKTVALVGGLSGEAVRRDFAQQPTRWVETRTPTRVCTTLLDQISNETTELVENAGEVSSNDIEAFLRALGEESAHAQYLILGGSLPPGAPLDFYRRALQNFSGKAIVDARGPELLEALSCRPFLIKPNREELARTVNRPLRDQADVLNAMHELNRGGAEWVLVTDGAKSILVTHQGRHQIFKPPAVERIVNPIGCGDCLTAGIADLLQRGGSIEDAIRWGMACAADNVAQLLPARIDRKRVAALHQTFAGQVSKAGGPS